MKRPSMFSLQGKVVLLTGGAGAYGQAMAQALAGHGAEVCLASRKVEALEAVAEKLRADGGKAAVFPLDQGRETSILALRDAVLERCGRIDVLVNNAVLRAMKGSEDPASAFAESMQVNATGLFSLCRAVGEVMTTQRSGSIINIASIQGLRAPYAALYRDLPMDGFLPDYFFHKGGMIQYTRFLAAQYGPGNVRCNSISPGGLATEKTPEPFKERYAEHTCLGRMAAAEDLAGAVVFFASDASAYITGTNLPVDGGYTAK